MVIATDDATIARTGCKVMLVGSGNINNKITPAGKVKNKSQISTYARQSAILLVMIWLSSRLIAEATNVLDRANNIQSGGILEFQL